MLSSRVWMANGLQNTTIHHKSKYMYIVWTIQKTILIHACTYCTSTNISSSAFSPRTDNNDCAYIQFTLYTRTLYIMYTMFPSPGLCRVLRAAGSLQSCKQHLCARQRIVKLLYTTTIPKIAIQCSRSRMYNQSREAMMYVHAESICYCARVPAIIHVRTWRYMEVNVEPTG